jgi:PAS domain S-box-containing protein
MQAETIVLQKACPRNITWAIFIVILFSILSVFSCPVQATGPDFLSPEERKWLQEHDGKILVAPDPFYPPMEYFDEKGTFRGIAADYIRLIENKLQYKFRIVRLNSFEEILEKARKGEIDIANTVIKTPERSEYLLFTSPYVSIPNVIVVRNDISRNLAIKDLKDMTGIVYQGGYAIGSVLARQGIIQARPITNPAVALKDLSIGRINVMVGNLAVISHYVRQMNIANLRVAGDCYFEDTISFASRKDWPILNRILDKTLKEITPQEREVIIDEWIRLEATHYYRDKRFWFSVLGVLSLIIIVITLLYVWNRMLKKQVAIKTAELKLREEALLQEKAFSDRLLDAPRDTVFLFESATGKPLRWNKRFAEVSGYHDEEIACMKAPDDFYNEDDLNKAKENMAILLSERHDTTLEMSLITNQGTHIPFEYSATAIVAPDGKPLILSIGRNITSRKLAEDKIKASLQEKETLLKEIHHRVKNNLQVISSLLDLQSSYLQDEKAKEMLHNSMDRIKTMAKIHTMLYQSEDMSRVDFRGFIRDLAGSLQQSYGIAEFPVRINVDVSDVSLTIETSIPCGLILNELVSNALKHAFPEEMFKVQGSRFKAGETGEITIAMTEESTPPAVMDSTLHAIRPTLLVLTVSDNGTGFPEAVDFHNTKSLGLELVHLLVGQINGTITMTVREGTTFTIMFPWPS